VAIDGIHPSGSRIRCGNGVALKAEQIATVEEHRLAMTGQFWVGVEQIP
jgi:hypothetical protein